MRASASGRRGPALSPDVDVVVPTRNAAPWIADCLDSLRAQTLTAWRAFVVLNGSEDGSARIARRYARRDHRIVVVESPRVGVSAARNLGFELGTAPFVAYLDADDTLEPSGLAHLVGTMRQTGSEVAMGRQVDVGAGGVETDYWTMQPALYAEARVDLTVRTEPRVILDYSPGNKLYRRDFLSGNCVVFSEDVAIGEDVEHTVTALCRARSIDIVAHVVARHRVRPGSLSAAARSESGLVEWTRVTRRVAEVVHSTRSNAVVQTYLARMLSVELWTRLVSLPASRTDDAVARFTELATWLIDSAEPRTWRDLPLVQRWAYESLGVAPQRALESIDNTTTLPEFSRFSATYRLSGSALRARLWRDALLFPAARVWPSLTHEQRAGAAARIVAFSDRFVAGHQLAPTDGALLAGLREPGSARIPPDQSLPRPIVTTTRVVGSRKSLAITAQLFSEDLGDELPRLIAVSAGRTAGIYRGLDTATRAGTDGVTVGARLRHRDLRPFGQWMIAVAPRGEGSPLVPLILGTNLSRRLPNVLCPLVLTGTIGRPVICLTRDALPRRIQARATTTIRARSRAGRGPVWGIARALRSLTRSR